MRHAERGSAVLITMMLAIALLGGGAILLGMQLHSTRSTGLVKDKLNATYCAESGLAAAHAAVAANHAVWSAALCNPPPPRGTGACVIGSAATEPVWLRSPGLSHDVDGDGVDDFILTLVDNDDNDGNFAADADDQVFVIATCIANPELPFRLGELVRYDGVTGKVVRRAYLQTD